MNWRKPELIFDPGDGSDRRQSAFKRIFWGGVALVALAVSVSAAFLLLAGLFTLLAFVLPILLVLGIFVILLHRHRTGLKRSGPYFDLDLR